MYDQPSNSCATTCAAPITAKAVIALTNVVHNGTNSPRNRGAMQKAQGR